MNKIALFILPTTIACNSVSPSEDPGMSLTHIDYSPTAFELEYADVFPILEIPADNPITMEKIVLGQHLFYDPILSADSTMSCASCHNPELSFADGKAVSEGIDGLVGTRSSMSLINVGFYYTGLFWDGRVTTLEEQALLPVADPIELHNNWPNLMDKLREHDLYPQMFREAFGISNTNEMSKDLAAKAIASFERVLISDNSLFDRHLLNTDALSDDELEGHDLFFKEGETGLIDAGCWHCHDAPLLTTSEYLNNGLDELNDVADYPDLGYGSITGNHLLNGNFRVPSLRNISLTAPYMHDGRFETLRDVINHYDSGGKNAPNKDARLLPLGLSEQEKDYLEAFLHTLVDTSYLSKDYIVNPFH